MANILITSGGKRVDLVKSFKKVMSDSDKVFIVDANKVNASKHFADKFFLAPKISDTQYLDFLKRIIKDCKIDLIFSVVDPELLILAKYKSDLEKLGCKVMVSPIESIYITNDKRKMTECLNKVGVRTPSVLSLTAIEQYPVFIKPFDGSRSINSYRVDNQDELEIYCKKIPNPFVTEYILGQEYTIDCFSDFEGNILNIIPRRRVEVMGGIAIKSVIEMNSSIITEVGKILKNLKVVGPSTVQCITNSEGNFFTDINLRFGGGVMLGIEGGGYFTSKIIQLMDGKEIKYDEKNIKDGLVMVAYLEHIFNYYD